MPFIVGDASQLPLAAFSTTGRAENGHTQGRSLRINLHDVYLAEVSFALAQLARIYGCCKATENSCRFSRTKHHQRPRVGEVAREAGHHRLLTLPRETRTRAARAPSRDQRTLPIFWSERPTHVESWDTHAVESFRDIIDIHLRERRGTLVLGGEAREHGRHLRARLTPTRGEIDYQERLRPDTQDVGRLT